LLEQLSLLYLLPQVLFNPTAKMEQQLDLTKLNDNDKKELNQVLTNEAQKSNIQQSECLFSIECLDLCVYMDLVIRDMHLTPAIDIVLSPFAKNPG
jgi:hypothetical protein